MQPSDFFTNSYKNAGKRPHSAKGKGPFSKKMDTLESRGSVYVDRADMKTVYFSSANDAKAFADEQSKAGKDVRINQSKAREGEHGISIIHDAKTAPSSLVNSLPRYSSDTRATEPATTKEVKFSDIRKMEQDYQKLTFRELAAEGKKHGVKVIPGYPMAKENAVMDITEARVGAKVYSEYLKHEDDKFHGRLGGGSGDQPRDEKGRLTFK